jgi:hypothetical protein
MSPKEKEMKAHGIIGGIDRESTIEYYRHRQRRDACVTEIENDSGR